jgi:hypothetical protein
MQRLTFLVMTLFLAVQAFSQSSFKFAPINVPGATATQARGINASGEVIGFYQTTACSNSNLQVPTCPTKGYKLVEGQFIRLEIPNAISTTMTGVNDYGDIVGFYQKSDKSYHGFLWLHQNVIKTIDYPGTTFATVPMGVDSTLQIVGGLWLISPTNGTFPEGGWVWMKGNFSVMDLGTSNCYHCTSVNGISNNGIIVGEAFRAGFFTGWLKEAADDDYFVQNGDTVFTGINKNTDIVGYSAFGGGWLAKGIEVNESTGDTEKNPAYIPVAYPNSNTTYPFGLNSHDAVVGTYEDGTGTHGFLAAPE